MGPDYSIRKARNLPGKRLMKICHVITRMIVGGAQENTLFAIKGHLEHDHETVLATGPTEGPEGRLLPGQKLPGLRIELVEPLVRELSPVKDWLAYHHLKHFFREEKFDVVHTHSSKAGVLGRIAARKAGVPVVVHTVHGQAFHPYQSKWKNRLYIRAEKYAARYCDRIFAVADAMIKQCVQAGIAPESMYKTVYSGMDLEPYLNAERDEKLAHSLNIPEGAPVVGKIARLFDLKGHDFLIEAAKVIVGEVPNVRFLLVGDGILRDKYEAAILAKNLEEYFIFAGLVSPADIPRYLGLMDVLVHLSLREGLPRSVVQALASGKPAVAYALDGAPEVIINGKTGYLCPPESTLGVAAAVAKLLQTPEKARAMGEAGRELVRQRWDWRRMVDVLEAEYAELLEQKTAPQNRA